MRAQPVSFSFRMSPAKRVVVLILIMTAVLLAAGCIEKNPFSLDYQPTHSIGVVKITTDGLREWSTVINNSLPGDITENYNGDYILSAGLEQKYGSAPISQLIKISHTGTILRDDSIVTPFCGSYELTLNDNGKVVYLGHSDPICPHKSTGDFAENSATNFTVRGMVVSTSDGGHIVAGYAKESRLITHDEFIERRQNQFQESKEYAEKMWIPFCGNASSNHDPYGYCTSSQNVTAIIIKTNPDGTVSWRHDFPNYRSSIYSVIEIKSGKGYLANFEDTVLRLNPDGNVTNITVIRTIPEYDYQRAIDKNLGNYSMISREKDSNIALLFDKDGVFTQKEYLPGRIVTPTQDDGFLVVSARDMSSPTSYTTLFFATKYNPNGSAEWQKQIISDNFFPELIQVIQTSDGGYLILSSRMDSRNN